ncbi:MAG: hypothetical protein CVU20_03300 [Betaproteobacteria bacterium HGW-Betaproteobacteria-14]|nr:MAG: hypothetical protein CVU20_03300 [Betaproteobacteria bacterium HGW-Betaproteobacteria-14]
MEASAEATGRACPLGYRYGAAALRACPEHHAATLYVIGGLYGNLPALEAILALAAREPTPVTLCFNGDFNWFDVDDAGFAAINRAVLEHDALLGNVEAELLAPGDDAGCGCAYPAQVDDGTVERSNRIHARLKATARRHPHIVARLGRLPMLRRYRVGGLAVGVVHGDAESLAGWRFDVAALDDPGNRPWLEAAFAEAGVDAFASTHTCLPALRTFDIGGRRRAVVNNGAAGMPNFRGERTGLITRIGTAPGPHPVLYGARLRGVHLDALPVPYDAARWELAFLANWPPGSDAHVSYFRRIRDGADFTPARARGADGL